MGEMKNQEDDLIGQIIRQELEVANRISSEDDRKRRLAGKLAIKKMESVTPRPLFLKRIYVLASATLAIVIVSVILSTLFTNGQTLGLSKYIEQQGVTFQNTIPAPPRQTPQSNTQFSGNLADEAGSGYLRMFLALLPTEVQDTRRTPNSILLLNPRMSFEETVRILYFDRSLEKFLSEYAKKRKEV